MGKNVNANTYALGVFKAMLTLVHLIGTVQFGYGCYYDYTYVNVPPEKSVVATAYGGKFKYLTFLNGLLQTLYFTIALLNDFIGTNENVPTKAPLIRKLKDILFSALAFPTALYVCTTFWSLYAVDRELVFPKVLDEFFPVWLNHLMHTNIMIFVLIEILISFRKYPSRKTGLGILTVFLVAYLVWMHIIYFHSGIWVYPVLAVLNWPLRVVFYLVSLVFGFGLYLIGEKLNNIIWAKQVAKIVKSSKKKAH